MKKTVHYLVMTLVLSAICAEVRAQSISDLLTQLTLDTRKLTTLKGILQDMYTGYETIDKGYTEIRNISEENFHLHQAFLNALLIVSSAVQHDPRITATLNAEYSILSECQTALSRFRASGLFTPQELSYIGGIYATIFRHSQQSTEELTMVVTPGQLRMSDAQRLQAVARIHTDIMGQLSFLRRFNNDTSIQALQRGKEAGDIGTLRSIYGIPD